MTASERLLHHARQWCDAPTGLMKELGYGEGDQYAHHVPAGYLPQEQLPDDIRGAEFHEPTAFGFEKDVTKRLAWWAELCEQMTRERGT